MTIPSPLPPSPADELIGLLHRRGPLAAEDIAAALGEDADDPDWDAELADAFETTVRLVELTDGRLADIVALLSGVTLTRRVDADEVAHARLCLGADLQPLVELIDDSVPLAEGGRARVVLDRRPGEATSEWLAGPDGWLGDLAAGELVGVRLHDGLLEVSVRPEPGPSASAAEAVAATAGPLLAEPDGDPPHVGLNATLWETLAAAPEAVAGVQAPLSDLAREAGLQATETMLLPADADLADLGAPTDAIHDGIARIRYGADADQLDDLAWLRDVTRRLEVGGDVGDGALLRAAHALADVDVLDCYLRETGRDQGAARLAAAAAPLVTGTAHAAACQVRAQVALAAGDAVDADAHTRAALDADPTHEPSLMLAARFAEARGDAAAAVRCLDAAGWGDTDWAGELRAWLAPRRDVGRNEPCPCGSGRKFKVCCAGRPAGAGPTQQAAWVWAKLHSFTDISPPGDRLRERLAAAGRLTDWVDEADDHPLVADVAIFDLGLLDDFLAGWGPLLPDAERAIAAAWRGSRRGLYHVERSHGEQATLTARADGARLSVHSPGGAPPAGRLLLARLLGDGADGWVLAGASVVDSEAHPAVARSLEDGADPLEVAELWGGTRPTVVTAENEPVVACVWQAPLAEGQGEALGRALRADGLSEDAPGVWRETVEVDGEVRLRGTVTVGDAEVTVDANAEARLTRLVERVRAVIGDVTARVDRRTPLWRAVEDRRRYGVPDEPTEPSAEEHALLADAVAEHERRWVDEPVPALDGLTPREARDHPTGRRALEELLASFPSVAGGMDPDRLRGLLDLPPAAGGAASPEGFAVPSLDGVFDGIDLALLDTSDEDDRHLHVQAEHELAAVWDGDDPYHDPAASPEAHYALHEIVAAQLVDGDPPEVWATARRLVGDGYERHEVLHMLAGAVAAELWHAQTNQAPFDHSSYLRRLELLPDSWEHDRGRQA